MDTKTEHNVIQTNVEIRTTDVVLPGILGIPAQAEALVLFAHGAGSSRLSPRNQYVAASLQQASLATLLMDLLSEEEEQSDIITRNLSFNIPFLADRVEAATDWVLSHDTTADMRLGYFGASTGAAAALTAAAHRPNGAGAIVSRGGRPDLAEDDILAEVRAPTLLIVGDQDSPVLELNQQAATMLGAEHELVVVPGATHLFEEPGKLDEVARHAGQWFRRHL